MHALPGIVDGARKVSQGGRSILVSARGRNRMFSLLSMLEATLSRDQCMQCMPGMNEVLEGPLPTRIFLKRKICNCQSLIGRLTTVFSPDLTHTGRTTEVQLTDLSQY